MFRAPFSFEGRIRRAEYGLSMIIYFIVVFIFQLLFNTIEFDSYSKSGDGFVILFFIFFIPMLWFMLAQGAKRCHDLGNSGWFQLIPFYGLWLLFADSKPGANLFGNNPKENTNPPTAAT